MPAFTVDGHGGNPAGVVLDAGGLDAAQMQAIAADVRDSETALCRHGSAERDCRERHRRRTRRTGDRCRLSH